MMSVVRPPPGQENPVSLLLAHLRSKVFSKPFTAGNVMQQSLCRMKLSTSPECTVVYIYLSNSSTLTLERTMSSGKLDAWKPPSRITMLCFLRVANLRIKIGVPHFEGCNQLRNRVCVTLAGTHTLQCADRWLRRHFPFSFMLTVASILYYTE